MASVNVYDLNYTDAFVLGIKNYANFKGRASRSEYWRFMAGMMMVQGTLGVVACLLYTSPSPRDMRRTRMPSSA